MSNQYTIVGWDGQVLAAHLSAEAAAIQLLTYDSASYSIEQTQDGVWALYYKRLRDDRWTRLPECSPLDDEDLATIDILRSYLARVMVYDDIDRNTVYTDADYEAQLEAFVADAIEDEDYDELAACERELAEWRANGGQVIHARIAGSAVSLCGHEPVSRGYIYSRAYWHHWAAVQLPQLRQAMGIERRDPCRKCVKKIGQLLDAA